jgi:type I restriction enzyme S subunit
LLDWNYFAYVLQSQSIQSWLHGIAFGATVPHIKVEDAENLQIPCPPIEIQRKIGSILSAYDDLIENNLQRIKLLEEMAQITYEEWFVRMRFPGHETAQWDKETGLPEGWEKGRLDKLFVLQRGFDLPVQDRKQGKVPIIASTGIIDWHSDYKVKTSGVVTGRSGTIGEVIYSHTSFWPLNTSLWIKKYHIGGALFAYHFLKNFDLGRFGGGSAVPSLDRKVVHSQQANIPPVILAEKFELKTKPIFDAVFQIKQQNELLREARDILLPRLMTGVIDVDQVEVPEALLARVA